MKNNSGSRIGRVLSRIINLRSWFDWDRIRSFTLYIINGFKKFFVPQKVEKGESFEAAKKRLKLNDSDILARQIGLLRLSILMVALPFWCLLIVFISSPQVGLGEEL